MAPLDGHLGARVDLEGLGHARAVAEEVAGEVVGAARERVAAGGVRARDRLVVLGRVVPVCVVETWERPLALCAEEAVGSLERERERAVSVTIRDGTGRTQDARTGTDRRGRTLTIWLDPVPIRSAPDPNAIGTSETSIGFVCSRGSGRGSGSGRGGSARGRSATTVCDGGGGSGGSGSGRIAWTPSMGSSSSKSSSSRMSIIACTRAGTEPFEPFESSESDTSSADAEETDVCWRCCGRGRAGWLWLKNAG